MPVPLHQRHIIKKIEAILPHSVFIKITYLYEYVLKKLNIRYIGMTTNSEQKYLENYTRKIYSGAGEIVDLGCWLGSTCIPLAKGLSQRHDILTKENRKIHAYDLFIWKDWMGDSICGHRKFDGEFFLNEFMEQIKPWASLIETHVGDLEKASWDKGKIECLVIDAMKSWDLANVVIHNFFPYLIPGCSHIIHMDFKHFYTSWIHLLNFRFRNCFELVNNIDSSGSIVLKYIEPMAPELIRADYSFESFSDEEIDDAFDYSLSLVPTNEKVNVVAAKIMTYIHMNRIDKAKKELNKYLEKGLAPEADLKIVVDRLAGM